MNFLLFLIRWNRGSICKSFKHVLGNMAKWPMSQIMEKRSEPDYSLFVITQ